MLEPQKLAGEAKPAEDKPAENKAAEPTSVAGVKLTKPVIGAGVAVGSAAIAAALLYWNRRTPKG